MIALLFVAILALVKAVQVNVPLGPVGVNVAIGSSLPARYVPLNRDDYLASDNARKFGVTLIEHASTGIYGIPPLDPFYKEELPFIHVNHELISAEIKITKLKITGVSTVTLGDVEVRMRNSRLDVDLKGLTLDGEAEYDATVKIGFLPVTYTGRGNVLLKGLKVTAATGAVKKMYKGVAVYQLDGLETAAHVDDAQLAIDKLLWDTVSGLMTKKELLDQAAPVVADALRTQVNLILRGFPASTVDQYLLGQINP